MVKPGIEPGTSWLVVRSSDHQATRLVYSVYCLCVLYYCHRLSTQLQLTNISNTKYQSYPLVHRDDEGGIGGVDPLFLISVFVGGE